jgi:hypothetical protein
MDSLFSAISDGTSWMLFATCLTVAVAAFTTCVSIDGPEHSGIFPEFHCSSEISDLHEAQMNLPLFISLISHIISIP